MFKILPRLMHVNCFCSNEKLRLGPKLPNFRQLFNFEPCSQVHTYPGCFCAHVRVKSHWASQSYFLRQRVTSHQLITLWETSYGTLLSTQCKNPRLISAGQRLQLKYCKRFYRTSGLSVVNDIAGCGLRRSRLK